MNRRTSKKSYAERFIDNNDSDESFHLPKRQRSRNRISESSESEVDESLHQTSILSSPNLNSTLINSDNSSPNSTLINSDNSSPNSDKSQTAKNTPNLKFYTVISKKDLNHKLASNDKDIELKEAMKPSEFWSNYKYVFYKDVYTLFVCCDTCSSLLKFHESCSNINESNERLTYNSGTSTMSTHYEKCNKKTSFTSAKNNQTVAKVIMPTEAKKVLTRLMVLCSALDMRAYSTFQGEGFKMLMDGCFKLGAKYGNMIYHPPSVSTISNNVRNLSELVEMRLKNELSTTKAISCILDHWTSDDVDFLGIKVAYEKNGDILSRVIYSNWVEDKTAECTRSTLDNLAEEFKILDKISSATTDNAESIKKSFVNPNPTDQNGNLRRRINWIGCISHRLNLALNDCFTKAFADDRLCAIKEMDENVLKLIGHVNRSSKSDLLDYTLKNQCPTRFDSKYLAYNSVILNKDRLIECEDETIKVYVDFLKFKLLESVTSILKLVFETRLILSKERECTINLVWPAKIKLLANLKDLTNRYSKDVVLSRIIPHFIDHLVNSLNNRMVITDTHKQATYLTPAFRNSNLINKTEIEFIKTRLEEDIKEDPKEVKDCELNRPSPITNESDDSSSISFFKDFLQSPEEEDQNDENLIELYHKFKFKPDDLNISPIKFWTRNSHHFKSLSDLAYCCLITPATSTSVERLFSNTSFTLNKTRNSLLPESVHSLMIIKSNSDLCEFSLE